MRNYKIRNTAIFHDYYNRLRSIALSRFKWCGLPETCNERFLELCLYELGLAVFVEDSEMRYLNLKVIPSDKLNVYNEPLSYTAYSIGYSKQYSADDCVIIRNNNIMTATDTTIMLYAERLAKLDIAMMVNVNAQKTPILIRCDDKTKKSLDVLYSQYDGDKPFIMGHKSLQEKPLEVLTTGAPFVVDKLREEKRALWNEVLEFLGLNTNPSDKKKERLIMSEVEANNEQIESQYLTMLMTRQEACEEINKKYGLNVSVSLRVDDEKKGEIENGELYNRTA